MVERGEKIPSLETFIKILNALEVSSDMVLADVLETGYTVKNSILNEKLAKLAPEDRSKITWTPTGWKPGSRMALLSPSTVSPSRMSTATPRHSGQSWTGCYGTSPWSTHRWC